MCWKGWRTPLPVMIDVPPGTMREIEVQGVKALVRDGTLDAYVVDEVIKNNTYRKLNLLPSDRVLDAGMNIGMFTVQALKAGAHVWGYEPDPENYQLAEHNVRLNGFDAGYELREAAIVGTNDQHRSFSLNVKKNKGAHSLVEKRGRTTITVACENVNTVLAHTRPTVVKMDIEGGEYEVLQAVDSFAGIRELILEFHHAHLGDTKTRTKYRETVATLKGAFPIVEYRADPKGAWFSMVYCRSNHG